MNIETYKIEPCSECPYPTNFTAALLAVSGSTERYAVSCRECGDSWVEAISVDDEENND